MKGGGTKIISNKDGSVVATWGHNGPIEQFKISGNRRYLVALSKAGNLGIWNLGTSKIVGSAFVKPNTLGAIFFMGSMRDRMV
jgi:WD40 repeat protein